MASFTPATRWRAAWAPGDLDVDEPCVDDAVSVSAHSGAGGVRLEDVEPVVIHLGEGLVVTLKDLEQWSVPRTPMSADPASNPRHDWPPPLKGDGQRLRVELVLEVKTWPRRELLARFDFADRMPKLSRCRRPAWSRRAAQRRRPDRRRAHGAPASAAPLPAEPSSCTLSGRAHHVVRRRRRLENGTDGTNGHVGAVISGPREYQNYARRLAFWTDADPTPPSATLSAPIHPRPQYEEAPTRRVMAFRDDGTEGGLGQNCIVPEFYAGRGGSERGRPPGRAGREDFEAGVYELGVSRDARVVPTT